MNTKLTLSLDSSVIENAKRDLQTKERSLSAIIEDYFRALLATKTKKQKDTPIVEELSGIVSLDSKISKNDIIADYLLEKYE